MRLGSQRYVREIALVALEVMKRDKEKHGTTEPAIATGWKNVSQLQLKTITDGVHNVPGILRTVG